MKLILPLLALASLPASAVVIADPDFEANPSVAPGLWTTFGNAFPDEPAPGINPGIEGAESLKMFGNFTQNTNFSGAFQDIAVDGVTLAVGQQIQLSGLLMQLAADPLSNGNVTAFLEITFVDAGGMEFGFGDNSSASLTNLSATDQWLAFETPTPDIPAGADQVRIKAVFVQTDGPDEFSGGAAWFDQIQLNVVPEPSSTLLLGLAGFGLLARRRR